MSEKKTFEEWIEGFEDRYTPEQLEMFKDVWETSVKLRDTNEKYANEETFWSMKWIHEVAMKIGK